MSEVITPGTAQEVDVYRTTQEIGLKPGAFFFLEEDLVNKYIDHEKQDPEDAFLYAIKGYTTAKADLSDAYVTIFPANILVDFIPEPILAGFKPKRSIEYIPQELTSRVPLLAFFESVKNGNTVRVGYQSPGAEGLVAHLEQPLKRK